MKLLKNKFASAVVVNAFSHHNYLLQLKKQYEIVFPEQLNTADAHAATVRKLRMLVNNPLSSFLAANGSQWFDGVLLYEAYKADATAAINAMLLFSEHKNAVKQALG